MNEFKNTLKKWRIKLMTDIIIEIESGGSHNRYIYNRLRTLLVQTPAQLSVLLFASAIRRLRLYCRFASLYTARLFVCLRANYGRNPLSCAFPSV